MSKENRRCVLVAVLKGLFLVLVPTFLLYIILIVCYFNNGSWYAELLAFVIPPVIIYSAGILIVVVLTRQNRKLWILPILNAVLCINPIIETIAFRFKSNNTLSDFKVMSYNVAAFNPSRMEIWESDVSIYKDLYNWFRNNESPDILCLQEFFHGTGDEYDLTLDSIALLGNYKYYYINPRYNRDTDGIYGVITFSKFRAINAGQIFYGDTLVNKGIYNDFIIKNDTLRVVNFQLKSMSIRWKRDEATTKLNNAKSNISEIVEKLIQGNESRKNELAVIESFLDTENYKTIICADINSVPYSSIYQRLNKNYYNAFEKAGTGLGFTYNRFPSVIRIDNQFYDKRLNIEYFKTRSDMNFSDHYPIEAGYFLKK